MHQKSSDIHGEWMDSCEQHNSIIQGVITCACGCGTVMHKNKWGDNKFFQEDITTIKELWKNGVKKYQEVLDSLPLCLCGCGEKQDSVTGLLWKRLLSQRATRFYKYLYGHDKRPRQWAMELANSERQTILGTLLGDASILYPNKEAFNPRLQFNHSDHQAAWAEHKKNYLKRIGGRLSRKVNRGYGNSLFLFLSMLAVLGRYLFFMR